MKKPLKRSDSDEFDVEADVQALTLLHMSDEEVDEELQAIALKTTENTVRRIHNRLPLRKLPANLSLVNAKEAEQAIADNTPNLPAIIPRLFAVVSISILKILRSFHYSRVAVGVASVLAVGIFVVAASAYKNSLAENSFATVAKLGAGEGVIQDNAVQDFTNAVEKTKDQKPQPGLPSHYSKGLLSLPDQHPVFDDSTLTIAVDTCRQCHSDMFARAQQQLL